MAEYSKTKDVKEKIMTSAHNLFSTHGYDNVKVIDIADDAGVAKGLVFYHFDSKEGLVNEILYDLFCKRFSMIINLDTNISPDIILFQIFDKMFNARDSLHFSYGYFEGDIPDKFHHSIDRARHDTVIPAMLELVLDGIEKGLLNITEPEIPFEIMSRGFDSFLHANTNKFVDTDYHVRFLRSAEYLLNSTLQPTKIKFRFERKEIHKSV